MKRHLPDGALALHRCPLGERRLAAPSARRLAGRAPAASLHGATEADWSGVALVERLVRLTFPGPVRNRRPSMNRAALFPVRRPLRILARNGRSERSRCLEAER